MTRQSFRHLRPISIAAAGVLCLLLANPIQAASDKSTEAAEARMMAAYDAEMEAGNPKNATKIVLDFAESTKGKNAPQTIKLMQKYAALLYQDREYKKSTEVLIEALERSTEAFGESGGDAFELNMNIGFAYSKWHQSLSRRMKYFDRALDILRERGEYESIETLTILVNIVVNMMDSGSLSGDYSSRLSDTMYSEQAAEISLPIESEYSNYFHKPEKYLREAIELSEKLEEQDEYIMSKIAILQAKLSVMETADLAKVPMGVGGYISGGTESEYYDREQERLTVAIEDLSRATDTNRIFLEAANKVLLEIAWLDKDEQRMIDMCTSGQLNSAGDYAPERLYEVMEGGMVFAPEVGVSVSTNIFKPKRSRGKLDKDEDGNPLKKPYFSPVCIDGQLMAYLHNMPTVTIEEIRRPSKRGGKKFR